MDDENPFRHISGFQDTAGAEEYIKLGARYYDGHGHFTQPDPLNGSMTGRVGAKPRCPKRDGRPEHLSAVHVMRGAVARLL